MKANNKSRPVRPYTSKELRNTGYALFLVGVMIGVTGYSYYRTGMQEQIVNTKWGTQHIASQPAGQSIYLILTAFGIMLFISGFIPLFRGLKK